MKNWMKIVIGVLLISSLGLMGATGLLNNQAPGWKPEAVNLALRQVAHQLYSLCGNQTARIEAVEQKDELTFSIKVDEYIDYDQLPKIMDQAMKDFNLPNAYGVAIKNCDEDIIELGYTYIALERDEVACQGRDHDFDCSRIELMIYDFDTNKPIWNYLLLTLLLGSIIALLIYSYIAPNRETEPEINPEAIKQVENNKISIGKFIFDYNNQTLSIDDETLTLTFRESKLLNYLLSNANQVLSRDQIQANVWEDEGVIVGRSLDVFISRLRKILKRDPSIQIKSIHGVGYRLEF